MAQILFSCVSEGPRLMVKSGDEMFVKLVEKLLADVKGEQRKAYVHENYSFNYLSTKEYIFLAVCDEEFSTRVAFAFLQHLEENFQPAAASRFELFLAEQMEKFSDPKKVDKIEAIKADLESTKEIMKENIDKIMERGQVLESLEESTASLDQDSQRFLSRANSLRNTMWWKNQRLRIAIGVTLVVVIFIIVWASCGATFSKCSGGPPEPEPVPAPTPNV